MGVLKHKEDDVLRRAQKVPLEFATCDCVQCDRSLPRCLSKTVSPIYSLYWRVLVNYLIYHLCHRCPSSQQATERISQKSDGLIASQMISRLSTEYGADTKGSKPNGDP